MEQLWRGAGGRLSSPHFLWAEITRATSLLGTGHSRRRRRALDSHLAWASRQLCAAAGRDAREDRERWGWGGGGWLRGRSAQLSWSQGCEFEPHVRCRAYVKKKKY